MESGFLEVTGYIIMYVMGFAVFVCFLYIAKCAIAMKDNTQAIEQHLQSLLEHQLHIHRNLNAVNETLESMNYELQTINIVAKDLRSDARKV